MKAQILDGKKIAATVKERIQAEVAERIKLGKKRPVLAVILIGSDPASQTYVNAKYKACELVGIQSESYNFPVTITELELSRLIDTLNHEQNVNGILVQLPLPEHIDKTKILEKIDPKKDVDGFHPYNLGRLCQRRPALRPCTPKGVMQLLAATGVNLLGKDAVIVGASEIVGRPMALELLMAGCTVSVTHRFTGNLAAKVAQADIVIVAVGKPNLVQGKWIKQGAIVIDVGITRMEDGSLCGDVEFSAAKERSAWITPVPGGVGPMTVACLLENTLEATTAQEEEINSSPSPHV